MRLKTAVLTLLFFITLVMAFSVSLVSAPSLPVHNIDTGLDYATIQEAIDAPETLDGHTIHVDAGICYEHVKVYKSLKLIGEDRATTIIDGSEAGTVVAIMADKVILSNFTIQNSGIVLTEHFPPMNKGIKIYNSNNVTIRNNNLIDNQIGIYVSLSTNVTLNGNVVIGNIWGISLEHSQKAVLRNNHMTSNTWHFNIWGEVFLERYIHDIDTSNTVDGKPVYYWVNQADKRIPQNAGYVVLVNSTNIVMKDLKMSNMEHLTLIYTKNSIISNVTLLKAVGFLLLEHSDNNIIKGNTIEYGGWQGIRGGFAHFEYSDNNMIHHNNFIRTAPLPHISFMPFSYNNSWDDGALPYPEGNFWNDYAGVDDGSGVGRFSEPRVAGDWVGDTNIPHLGLDWYPLMSPYVPPKPPVGVPEFSTPSLLITSIITALYIIIKQRFSKKGIV